MINIFAHEELFLLRLFEKEFTTMQKLVQMRKSGHFRPGLHMIKYDELSERVRVVRETHHL